MKKIIISLCFLSFIASSFVQSIQFETALTWMYNNGLTIYNSPQEFRQNDKITRGETAKFVSKYAEVIGLQKATNSCDFSDIDGYDATLVPHIIESCRYGLLKGSNGSFKPLNTITEAEAMTLIIRSYEGMQDETTIPWYQNYFNKAMGLGLLNDADTIDSVGNTAISRERLGTWFYALGWKLEQGIITSKIPQNQGNNNVLGQGSYQKIDIFSLSQQEPFVSEFNTSTSFAPLSESSSQMYYKKDGKVYFKNTQEEFAISNADVSTFRNVGFFGLLVGGYRDQYITNYYGYAIDKNNVYFMGKAIPGADPYSFVSLYVGYASDNNYVYYRGIRMPCADAATFDVVDRSFSFAGNSYLAKDKNYSYFDGNPIDGGDANCFIVLPKISVVQPVEESTYRDYSSHDILHTDFNQSLDVTIQEDYKSMYEAGQKVTVTVKMDKAEKLILSAKAKDFNTTLVDEKIIQGQNTFTYIWTIPSHLVGEYIRFNALIYGENSQEYYNTTQGFEILPQKTASAVKRDFPPGYLDGLTYDECGLSYDEDFADKTYAVGDKVMIGLLPRNLSTIRNLGYLTAPTNSSVIEFYTEEVSVDNDKKVSLSFTIPSSLKNSYIRFVANAFCKPYGGVRAYSIGGIFVK